MSIALPYSTSILLADNVAARLADRRVVGVDEIAKNQRWS
jgi:hypothetical protein